ncbi:Glucose/mannose transporter GlcP [Actinomadura rubteroloni]|uniref:Glucose/mannose transporter GlcP n=1 Tax=Actinomadura rubteroloni TaxID=1926885 RepID=A0A2P4UR50_9ACTN|nr:MFS transporter [Actinomadura rubteroloni]POM27530.1 Glucose/mannose transporter GlcP [Actinomadura rubteroloni]
MLETREKGLGGAAARSVTTAYFVCFAMVGALSAMLGPSLPVLSDASGLSASALSVLFTADSVGAICGALFAGRVFDRLDPHAQLALGLGGIAAAVAAIPLADSLLLLVLGWWALGASKIFVLVTANTLLMRQRGEDAGPYVNAAQFFAGLGSLLMPALIAQALGATGGLHLAYWAMTGLAVLLVARLRALPVPAPAVPEPEEPERRAQHRRIVATVAVLFFFYEGAEIGFSGWLPSFTLDQGITDSSGTAAYYTSVFWIAMTLGRLLCLPIARRTPAERILLTSLAACCTTLGALLLFGSTSLFVVFWTFAFGLSMASIFPAAFTMLNQRGAMNGRTNALCMFAASGGAMFFPLVIGQFVTLRR